METFHGSVWRPCFVAWLEAWGVLCGNTGGPGCPCIPCRCQGPPETYTTVGSLFSKTASLDIAKINILGYLGSLSGICTTSWAQLAPLASPPTEELLSVL